MSGDPQRIVTTSATLLSIEQVTGLDTFFYLEMLKAALRPLLPGDGDGRDTGYAHKMADQIRVVALPVRRSRRPRGNQGAYRAPRPEVPRRHARALPGLAAAVRGSRSGPPAAWLSRSEAPARLAPF